MFLLNASAWHSEPGVHHRLSSRRQNPSAISSEKQPEALFGQGWQSVSLRAAPLWCAPNDAAFSSLSVRHAELGGAKPRSHLHSGVRLQVQETPPSRRVVFAGRGAVEMKQKPPVLP